MIDPDTLATQLPTRPLRPDEVPPLMDRLGWSALPIVYERADGVEYVPRIHCYDADTRRALSLQMDDALETWSGDIVREDVDRDRWLEVQQAQAKEMGTEISVDQIVSSDGTVREFE